MPRAYTTALVSSLVCACASEAIPAAEPRTEASAPEPTALAEREREREPASCEQPSEIERVELEASDSKELASGLELRFVGSSWDHYEDGSFDQLAEFRFRLGEQNTSEIISALAPNDPPSFRPVLGHCWRLVGLSESGAIVEVAQDGQSSQD